MKLFILGEIDRISPYFFGQSGQGGLIMDDLCILGSNINSIVRKKHFSFYDS